MVGWDACKQASKQASKLMSVVIWVCLGYDTAAVHGLKNKAYFWVECRMVKE